MVVQESVNEVVTIEVYLIKTFFVLVGCDHETKHSSGEMLLLMSYFSSQDGMWVSISLFYTPTFAVGYYWTTESDDISLYCLFVFVTFFTGYVYQLRTSKLAVDKGRMMF